VPLFRWRGIFPLALFLAILSVGWLLFGDRVVESTGEEAMTKLLGAEVSIDGLRLRSADGLIEVRGLAIADPFDRRRNLLETGPLRLEIEQLPLLEKKLVIRRLVLSGLRFGVPRTVPAAPAPPDGFAARTLGELRRWRSQFEVPLLQLTPVDTIRSLVLDPTQLASVRAALALRDRTDSLRAAIDTGWRSLRLEPTLDSARALGARLAGVNVRTLGLDGTRQAIADVKRTLADIDAARRRVEALERDARLGVASLSAGVGGLDEARRRDYAFARGLLKLPTFDGPSIGTALFGDVSIDRFQQALYWAELAERYMPPGLRPRQNPGPKRVRRSGTSVHFEKATEYPSFLLRRGELSFSLAEQGVATAYSAAVLDITSQPAIVGRPTRFAARRRGAGTVLGSLQVNGLLDHLGAVPRDSVSATAEGVRLPSFDLPGLPLRAELGSGAATLRFARQGGELRARWAVRASQVRWEDRSGGAAVTPLEKLVTRTVAGIQAVDVVADLEGPIGAPRLSVRSNLDRVIAERVRAVAGEALARVEATARQRVDSLAEEKAAPVRAQVAAVRADAERRVADARARLEQQRSELDAKLKTLTGGLLQLPRIPGR
jgi:uncharacterized protein (TIGR03545 family)